MALFTSQISFLISAVWRTHSHLAYYLTACCAGTGGELNRWNILYLLIFSQRLKQCWMKSDLLLYVACSSPYVFSVTDIHLFHSTDLRTKHTPRTWSRTPASLHLCTPSRRQKHRQLQSVCFTSSRNSHFLSLASTQLVGQPTALDAESPDEIRNVSHSAHPDPPLTPRAFHSTDFLWPSPWVAKRLCVFIKLSGQQRQTIIPNWKISSKLNHHFLASKRLDPVQYHSCKPQENTVFYFKFL